MMTVSCVTCHMSYVMCPVSNVTSFPTFHPSHVTCHLSPTPTATTQTLPLLTPPLYTVGWFTQTLHPPSPQTNRNLPPKKVHNFEIFVICYLTRSFLLSWFRWPYTKPCPPSRSSQPISFSTPTPPTWPSPPTPSELRKVLASWDRRKLVSKDSGNCRNHNNRKEAMKQRISFNLN